MPSPFPGMDPFLESPAFFGDLRLSLPVYLREYVQPRLPEPYYAEIAASVNDSGREAFLEIYTRLGDGERLVTAIGVLSPSSKTPGEQGRMLYLRKQQDILARLVNFVEIDLLRSGEHTTLVSLDQLRHAGPFDYHVCVRRFDVPGNYDVYPIPLTERLPTIAVPLLLGEEPLAVDLQAVFDRCYDSGPYRRRVRYREPVPGPELSATQSAWVEQVLRQHNLWPA